MSVKNYLYDNGIQCDLIEDNYGKSRNGFIQLSFNKLFNLNIILEEIKKVFINLKKDKLNSNDVFSADIEDLEIPMYVKKCFLEDGLTYKAIIENINIEWQIYEIYLMLKNNENIKVSREQKTFIENWCIGVSK